MLYRIQQGGHNWPPEMFEGEKTFEGHLLSSDSHTHSLLNIIRAVVGYLKVELVPVRSCTLCLHTYSFNGDTFGPSYVES